MQYAMVDGKRCEADPLSRRGFCPTCGEEVIAKCGEILIWHWSHKSESNCENREPETEWHRKWKAMFPEESREVSFERKRRADVFYNNTVFEFQNSHISWDDFWGRNQFYKSRKIQIQWIFNGANWSNKSRLLKSTHGNALIQQGEILVNARSEHHPWYDVDDFMRIFVDKDWTYLDIEKERLSRISLENKRQSSLTFRGLRMYDSRHMSKIDEFGIAVALKYSASGNPYYVLCHTSHDNERLYLTSKNGKEYSVHSEQEDIILVMSQLEVRPWGS